jgi:GIY-YIG catalytic domain
MPISGVYYITNKITGKTYVGSSSDVESRWYSHRNGLTTKKAASEKGIWLRMRKDLGEQGVDHVFSFDLIEEVVGDRESVTDREEFHLEKVLSEKGPELVYNKHRHCRAGRPAKPKRGVINLDTGETFSGSREASERMGKPPGAVSASIWNKTRCGGSYWGYVP